MVSPGESKWHGFCSFDLRKGDKMKKLAIIIFCLVLCGAFAFSYPQEEYYANSFARLSYVKGDVFLQRTEDMGYEEGTVNLPVVEGDKLGTNDGRAEIHFGKSNYLRVDQYTQIDFVRLPRMGDDSVSLHLFSGNIYLRVNTLDREREFELHTPDGSFYVLEEGLYRFEVSGNQETFLDVVEGTVEAAGEEGSELVRSGERVIVANGFFTFGPDYFYASQEDGFTEWNRSRDMFQNRYVRSRYLPVELNEYEAELDYYGRWTYERPYGYVWIPDVYHYSWRPYYNGRWAWYPICGWTWVSYEPWGWCVSHYGRWHWRVGLGWYWIPTRHWGPAWVHWYSGYDYIGWCPLSYYNRPVVIVNNNFYGRNYDQYYPLHSRALTVIRKDQLSARQVSKVALDQSRVARLGKISLSSVQPNIRPTSNRVSAESAAASKVLSRSGLRQVSKSYSSGNALRSSQRQIAGSAETPRISSRSQTFGKSGISTGNRSSFSATSSRIPGRITPDRNQSSRSGIKVYPSRNSIGQIASRAYSRNARSTSSMRDSQISRTPARIYSPAERIKTYPSQRSLSGSRQSSTIQRTRTYSSGSFGLTTSPIRKYSPSISSSSRSRSSSSARSTSSLSRQYSYRSSPSPTFSSRTYASGSSTRSSPARSSYSSSGRSSPRINYTSPSIKSSSSSRSFRSTSPSRSSKSSAARTRTSSSRSPSRSGSSSRIKKK
jgi:hypothetical protein